MNTALMFSSATDQHSTPQDLFDQLNREFHFTVDVAASQADHKVEPYFALDHPSPERRDGRDAKWTGRVWCNPPYGKGVGEWLFKGWDATLFGHAELVVFLLPARTDTKWFHGYCTGRSTEVRLLEGRLKFGTATNAAPFPSMLVVMRAEPKPYRWSVM
jgi:hypothetical protein